MNLKALFLGMMMLAYAAGASAGELVLANRVDTDQRVSAMAISKDGAMLYYTTETFANSQSMSVLHGLNSATGAVSRDLMQLPYGGIASMVLLPDLSKAYLGSHYDQTLIVVDLAAMSVLKTVSGPGDGLLLSPDGTRVYAYQSNHRDPGITEGIRVLNGADASEWEHILPGGGFTMTIENTGSYIYSHYYDPASGGCYLRISDLTTHELDSTTPVQGWDGVADRLGLRYYTRSSAETGGVTNQIFIYDIISKTLLESVTLPTVSEGQLVAEKMIVRPDNKRLYVAASAGISPDTTEYLLSYDQETMTLVDTLAVPGFNYNSATAFSPAGDTLYASVSKWDAAAQANATGIVQIRTGAAADSDPLTGALLTFHPGTRRVTPGGTVLVYIHYDPAQLPEGARIAVAISLNGGSLLFGPGWSPEFGVYPSVPAEGLKAFEMPVDAALAAALDGLEATFHAAVIVGGDIRLDTLISDTWSIGR